MNAGAAPQSQWALIRRRFGRHLLAVASLYIIIGLYLVALFADFIAPYSANFRDRERITAPPQVVSWSWQHGLHAPNLIRHRDPVTMRVTYVVRTEAPVPMGFMVSGEPWHLFGFIPIERRLFGVDRAAWEQIHPGQAVPTVNLLGADLIGQDVCSRIIIGSRVSLSIGLIAIVVTFALGISIGGISGYVGGRTDTVLQRLIEVINAFPQLPMWLALAALVPADWSPLMVYFGITIVLSLLGWTGLARVVRGKILSLREEDYCTAARLTGASHGRILFVHLLPGFTSHIIVCLTMAIPGMIMGETAMSFLGLGLKPPVVSWGVMLQSGSNLQAVALFPWLLTPVLFIILTMLAFNFFGDGLRDAADPYASR